MNLTLFAWKNLRRHPGRTALKALGLGAATAAMIVWGSLTRGFTTALKDTATSLELGEVELHHPRYLVSQSPYDRIKDDKGLTAALVQAGFAVAPRAYGSVLAAADERSAGALLRGVDPVQETTVTRLDRHVLSGTWLQSSHPHGVVIGKGLAKKLGLAPGGDLIVLGQAMDGSLSSEIFQVQGILKAVSKDLDDRGVFLALATFRDVFQMPVGIHELALAKPGGQIEATGLKHIQELASAVEVVDVKTWQELKPLLARMIALLSVTVYFTMSFTYLALGGLILNTVFMTIYDRMRQYGVMKAVGMLPSELLRLILAEAGGLALLATGVALALGLPLAWHLQSAGLDLSAQVNRAAFAGVNLEPVVFADVGVWQVLVPLLALLIFTPLFALIPALEASRLTAKEALQRL